MSILTRGLLGPYIVTGGYAPGVVVVHEGSDILAAVQSWWAADAGTQLVARDRKLWNKAAPPEAVLPYATYFLVHEVAETWTTGYAWVRASVQVNCHASTDAEARAMAIAIADSLEMAPLSVAGRAVTHVLPDASGLEVGVGFGPDGDDIWIAFQTFDICWTRARRTA